jgi:hypothetical protein
MAMIQGIELKNVKNTHSMENDGFTANIYLDGKFAGSAEDWGEGGSLNINYTNKQIEHIINKRIKSYAQVTGLDKAYEVSALAFLKSIGKDKSSVSEDFRLYDEEHYFNDLYELHEIEKHYKKNQKKYKERISRIAIFKYSYAGAPTQNLYSYVLSRFGNEQNVITELQRKANDETYKVFSGSEDFIINV